MKVGKLMVRSLVVSFAVAAVVLATVQVLIGVSYSSSMTPQEQESLKSMTYVEGQVFIAERQVVARGWPALRELYRSSSSRKGVATRTLVILVLCGFFSSLCVVAWNKRTAVNGDAGVPNKPAGR